MRFSNQTNGLETKVIEKLIAKGLKSEQNNFPFDISDAITQKRSNHASKHELSIQQK